MLRETCTQISRLKEHSAAEQHHRYLRRNRIRHIDDLLNQFEQLNLADEAEVPGELTGRVKDLVVSMSHPIAYRPLHDVRIGDWMEALYEVQDRLMLPADDND